MKENKSIARRGGMIAKNTRNNLEEELEQSVISNSNNINVKYLDNNIDLKH